MRKLDRFLVNWCPRFIAEWRLRKIRQDYARKYAGLAPAEVFRRIHADAEWGRGESKSGPGSSIAATNAVRSYLERFVSEHRIKTLLDVPCGDFNWMRLVDLKSCAYTGGDIVDELVAENQRAFGSGTRTFARIDLIEGGLPRADLILCRDCLFHFSYRHFSAALTNIKASGSEYLLTTTFPSCDLNYDIVTGGFRPLNLRKPPFNFPTPIELIPEERGEGAGCAEKSLGLWRIASIPDIQPPMAVTDRSSDKSLTP